MGAYLIYLHIHTCMFIFNRMIKIKNLKGIGIEGIHYIATKSKETRNKIRHKQSQKILAKDS